MKFIIHPVLALGQNNAHKGSETHIASIEVCSQEAGNLLKGRLVVLLGGKEIYASGSTQFDQTMVNATVENLFISLSL